MELDMSSSDDPRTRHSVRGRSAMALSELHWINSIWLDIHRPEIPDFETNLSRTSSWSIDLSCALTLRSVLGLFHCQFLSMTHKL